jgi:paraquat-inducible protein B
VEFLGASASEWVNGGIRIIPGEKGAMQSRYPLYANLEKALENSLSDLPTTTLSLTPRRCRTFRQAPWCCIVNLPSARSSPFSRANAFDIDLHIKPEYRHLLTNNSVFWAEGGAKVQLNGNGLTVQASRCPAR